MPSYFDAVVVVVDVVDNVDNIDVDVGDDHSDYGSILTSPLVDDGVVDKGVMGGVVDDDVDDVVMVDDEGENGVGVGNDMVVAYLALVAVKSIVGEGYCYDCCCYLGVVQLCVMVVAVAVAVDVGHLVVVVAVAVVVAVVVSDGRLDAVVVVDVVDVAGNDGGQHVMGRPDDVLVAVVVELFVVVGAAVGAVAFVHFRVVAFVSYCCWYC